MRAGVEMAVLAAGMTLFARTARADPTPPAASSPVVQIHLDAPADVSLEVQNDDGWETVCRAPCDRPLPTAPPYRVVAPGMRDSRTFHVDPSSRLTLHVEPTSAAGHGVAVAVTVVGGVAMIPAAGTTVALVVGELAGLILLCPIVTAFASKSQQNAAYGNCLGDIGTFFAKGYTQPWVWIPAVAGAGALTGGIIGIVSTPPSAVTQSSAVPGAAFTLPPAPGLTLLQGTF